MPHPTPEQVTHMIWKLRSHGLDKDNMPRMSQERWFPIGDALEAANMLEALAGGLVTVEDLGKAKG